MREKVPQRPLLAGHDQDGNFLPQASMEPPNTAVLLSMCYMSSLFLVVEPNKNIFLMQNNIPKREDIILLYIGYDSIPKLNTTHMGIPKIGLVLGFL